MPRVGMPVPGIDFLDEGVLLARKEQADFAGAGVTGTVSGTKVVETIPGGAGGVTDHGDLTGLLDDDHTQYQKESEKGAASGYASLDSTTKVPAAELGSGTPDGTRFLRDDRSWQVPAGALTPASTVADETTEGIAAAVGVDTDYAREDHTHGTGNWRRRLYLDMYSHQGGAGPLDLATYTIPAGLLGSAKGLYFIATFTRAGADTKTITIVLGSTTIYSDSATSSADMVLQGYIFNEATTVQRIIILQQRGTSASTDYTTAGEDTTAAIVLKFTGNSANISQDMFLVELIP